MHDKETRMTRRTQGGGSDTELTMVLATKSRNNDNGNPRQGESSKCGNLQSRSLARRSPPPFARISHPRNRCPLASWFSPDPPWAESLLLPPPPRIRSAWCRARDSTCFPPHCVCPTTEHFRPSCCFLVSPLEPSFRTPPFRNAACACVRRVRACMHAPACERTRMRACSCNNNKKRATLWGTNGLRPVHPMLGGAGLILYPWRFSTCGIFQSPLETMQARARRRRSVRCTELTWSFFSITFVICNL